MITKMNIMTTIMTQIVRQEHMHGPSGIDAVFFGLKDQRSIIQVQREVAAYEAENLMAVIPGITLSRIWQIIGLVDRGFIAINILIIGLVLLSMVAMTVLSADNRRREMSILRALGCAASFSRHVDAGGAVYINFSVCFRSRLCGRA